MALVDSSQTERSNRRFVAHAMRKPLLTRERECALARRWHRKKDEAALHELVEAHARLVVRIASGFRSSGLPVADLMQEGNIGLMEAADRFDPERNVRFSTYATWWIVAAIQNHILRNSSIVRAATSPKQRRLFFSLRRLRARYAVGFDGLLPAEERARIAEWLGVGTDDVQKLEAHISRPDQSLNVTVGLDDSVQQQDLIADTAPTPEDLAAEESGLAVRRASVRKALDHLSAREQRVIAGRFLQERRTTLAEIGEEFGVSKERIRQIESRALQKMLAALSDFVERPEELLGS